MYQCVRVREQPTPAFKVKISKDDVQQAVVAAAAVGCFVDLWRDGGMGTGEEGRVG